MALSCAVNGAEMTAPSTHAVSPGNSSFLCPLMTELPYRCSSTDRPGMRGPSGPVARYNADERVSFLPALPVRYLHCVTAAGPESKPRH